MENIFQKLLRKNKTDKICVYTCITGKYDKLIPITYQSKDIDYICFVDDITEYVEDVGWKIEKIPDNILNLGISNVKIQRLVKICPHLFLDKKYKTSLWIDANINPKTDLYNFIKHYDLKNTFMYTMSHFYRSCIYDEAVKVIQTKKDLSENVFPQIERYRNKSYPENNGLKETGIILRKHFDDKCIHLMTDWFIEIINGSHRDQLSLDYCLWKNNVNIGILNKNTFFNDLRKPNRFFELEKHLYKIGNKK